MKIFMDINIDDIEMRMSQKNERMVLMDILSIIEKYADENHYSSLDVKATTDIDEYIN